DKCSTPNLPRKAADMENIDRIHKKDMTLELPQNPEDQADENENLLTNVEDVWDNMWTNRWDEEEFEQYLENKRQRRELVQQLNDDFYREITLMAQMEYQLPPELEEATEMDINNEYLVDSPKWSNDEL
ncbi:14802_t:CDS:2, partial [Racocetra persica]